MVLHRARSVAGAALHRGRVFRHIAVRDGAPRSARYPASSGLTLPGLCAGMSRPPHACNAGEPGHECWMASAPMLPHALLGSLALCACATATGSPRADTTITVGGAEIAVELRAGHLDVSRAELMAWVTAGAGAVAGYYGRFPVCLLYTSPSPRDS